MRAGRHPGLLPVSGYYRHPAHAWAGSLRLTGRLWSGTNCPVCDRSSRFQPGFHLFVVHQAGLLPDGPPALKHNKVGNSADVEACGYLGVALGVHLDNYGFPCQVRGRAGNLRCGHAARPAPFRPEVHHHRDRRLLDDLVECLRIDLNRIRYWRQRGFARAALPGVGQAARGNSILASASVTRSNDWHGSPQVPTLQHQPRSCKTARTGLRPGDGECETPARSELSRLYSRAGPPPYTTGSPRLPLGGRCRKYTTICQISPSLRIPFAAGIPEGEIP